MLKYSKSLVMLMGSASVLATMAVKPVKADESLRDQFYAGIGKITAAPRNVWNALPSREEVAQSVKAKGTAFAKEKAKVFVAKQAGEVAEFAKNKFHALMYRHSNLKIVDGRGVTQDLYIEDANPALIRNFVRNTLGIDLDRDIPLVPAVMARVVNNVIEKQAAQYLEANFQERLNTALTQLAMASLERGLGLAQAQVNVALANTANSEDLVVEEEKTAIKAALVEATPIDETLAEENLSAMSELVMAIRAKLKFKIHSWINEVANETATSFVSQFVEQTGEGVMRGAEVTAGGVATLATAAVTGGTGAVLMGAAIHGDRYIAEGAPETKSYMRQALEWLTGYDAYKEEIQEKITIATTNQINGNIDAVLKKVGAGALVMTQRDNELLNGRYAAVETEVAGVEFTNLEMVEEPYSLDTFVARIKDNFKKKATVVLQQVQETVGDLTEAAGDFAWAMGPGLAYEEPKPTEKEILQNEVEDALERGDFAAIGERFAEMQKIAEEQRKAAEKSWWKFW